MPSAQPSAPTPSRPYVLFLPHEADWLGNRLHSRAPTGWAMFSGDGVETFNRLLKIAAVLMGNDAPTIRVPWAVKCHGTLSWEGCRVLKPLALSVFTWLGAF